MKKVKDLKVGDVVYIIKNGRAPKRAKSFKKTKVSDVKKLGYVSTIGKDTYDVFFSNDDSCGYTQGKDTYNHTLFDIYFYSLEALEEYSIEQGIEMPSEISEDNEVLMKKETVVKVDKFVEILKEMALEAAEYHPSDLEDDGDEWAEEFVGVYADKLKKLV